MEVKIKLEEGVKLPEYATKGAAGFDLAAKEDVYIDGNSTRIVKTGIFMEVPEGYELQVRPRSGTSLKTPLRIANAPGTIDSDYRGEIGIIVDNVDNTGIWIKKGERIAQGVFAQVPIATWNLIKELSITERGSGGFGSTGK